MSLARGWKHGSLDEWKGSEQMIAQLTTDGDVNAITKTLKKQFWEGEIHEHPGMATLVVLVAAVAMVVTGKRTSA